jgi:predicted porin
MTCQSALITPVNSPASRLGLAAVTLGVTLRPVMPAPTSGQPANVGIGGFTVGGSYAFTKTDDANNDQNTVFDVGVTYNIDAVTVGLGWSRGEYDNPNVGGKDTFDQIQLGVGYALGPGVTLAAMVGFFNYDSDHAENNEGYQAAVGAGLNF